jgi:hypothetical protein
MKISQTKNRERRGRNREFPRISLSPFKTRQTFNSRQHSFESTYASGAYIPQAL